MLSGPESGGEALRTILTGTSFILALVVALFGVVRIVGGRGVAPFAVTYGELGRAGLDRSAIEAHTRDAQITERFVPLRGTSNTRDIGGYPVADGPAGGQADPVVRSGLFYRSGHLSRLTDADVAKLQDTGIATIIDLREASRIDRYPNRQIPGSRTVHLPIYDEMKPLHFTILLNRQAISDRFREFYIEYLEEWAPRFAPVFRLLADETAYPVLVHCTNGKDRVGVVTALLLDLLGVPRETIVADFLLSNAYLDEVVDAFVEHEEGRLLLTLGVPREHLNHLMGVEPGWIVSALEHIDETYGSSEQYLVSRVGMEQESIDRIRAILLDAPGRSE